MGIQINGTNDTISAADGGLDVSGFRFENKTTAQRNAGVSTATGAAIYNTTTNQLEVYSPSGWVVGAKETFSATGGTKDTTSRSQYAVHTFTSPGTLVVSAGTVTGEYLVIAGGGGGAGSSGGGGGGGGAGGHRTSTSLPLEPGTYTITVGGGGAGGTNPHPAPTGYGANGSDSSIANPNITTITSTGGGGGSQIGRAHV